MRGRSKNIYWVRFCEQERNANRRGIAWELTFDQWLSIWTSSGRWNERGTRRGQYVMARFGDAGPYAIGNVEIVRAEKNNSDGNRGKTLSWEHRKKLPGKTSEQLLAEYAADPNRRLRVGEHTRSSWNDPDTRLRRRLGLQRYWATQTQEQKAARTKAANESRKSGCR